MKKVVTILASMAVVFCASCNCIFATRSVVYQLMQDTEKGGASTANGSITDAAIQADESDSGKVDLTK